MPQFDSRIRQTFIGRHNELDILSRELLAGEPRAVCIAGLAGVGKTSLAWAFADLNKSAFPGGVFRCHATPLEPLDKTVNREITSAGGPHLIIIDDLECRPELLIDQELRSLREKFPAARLIFTTRYQRVSGAIYLQLSLGNLTQAEFSDLLKKRLALAGTPQLFEQLYARLMGHPLAAQLAAGLLERGDITPRELIEKLNAFTSAGMIDFAGKEITERSPAHRQILSDIVSVSDEFLRK